MTGRYIEYGGIITDAERDIRTGDRLAREVSGDELELVHEKNLPQRRKGREEIPINGQPDMCINILPC
ncbi:MAG TPA: hypothetical protein VJ396_06240 [Acidiferrobacterales bacterium]|nr:hypothetical protein [Acidiferrobacterales bacterium]